jgi:hypothetical protein
MEHVDDGQLNALLDGELEAAAAARVRSHLDGCSACRGRFEEARRFLEEAGALLDVLAPPGVEPLHKAAGPVGAEPPVPRRVPVTAKEAAIDPAAAPRRVSKTAKEVAIDLDGRTQKTPAVRPLFSRETDRSAAEEPVVAPRRPRMDWTQLSWAAIVVLALSVGYLANEIRRGGSTRRDSLVEMARGPAQADSVAGAAAPYAGGRAGAGAGAAEERSGAGATGAPAGGRGSRPGATPQRPTRLQKPPTARGAKPPTQDRAADLAIAGAEAPPTGAGVGAAPPQPAAATGRERAAPTGAPITPAAPASAADSAAAQLAAPTGALAGAREGAGLRTTTGPAARREPAAPTGFRRITLDEAARRLAGSVRLIDGLIPGRVEVGSGRLVQGADAGREVIRVLYTDAAGRRLTLEQQRLSAPTEDPTTGRAMAEAATGMTASDTIASTSPQGTVRIRWLDGRGFWLSLAGTMPPDSLRALVARVR